MGALKGLLLAVLLLASVPANAAGPLDRWAAHIAEASSRFGIPAEWIRRVILAESGGHAALGGLPALSPAGAMGLMQLMPGTWRSMRDRLDLGPDPFDPHDNILAGSAYLRLMYDRFGYPGLFAAYNAGPARYRASLTGRRALPVETRSYVAAVAGSAAPARRTFPSLTQRLFAVASGPPPAAAARPDGNATGASGLFIILHSTEPPASK